MGRVSLGAYSEGWDRVFRVPFETYKASIIGPFIWPWDGRAGMVDYRVGGFYAGGIRKDESEVQERGFRG